MTYMSTICIHNNHMKKYIDKDEEMIAINNK